MTTRVPHLKFKSQASFNITHQTYFSFDARTVYLAAPAGFSMLNSLTSNTKVELGPIFSLGA